MFIIRDGQKSVGLFCPSSERAIQLHSGTIPEHFAEFQDTVPLLLFLTPPALAVNIVATAEKFEGRSMERTLGSGSSLILLFHGSDGRGVVSPIRGMGDLETARYPKLTLVAICHVLS